MDQFHDFSGGKDKFLIKNKNKKQKILNQNKEKLNILIIQNKIRSCLAFKTLKDKYLNSEPIEVQNTSMNRFNLQQLWILTHSDMKQTKFRNLVLQFWGFISNQSSKQINLSLHFCLLSRLASLVVQIVMKFCNQQSNFKNEINTIIRLVYIQNIELSSQEFEFMLLNVVSRKYQISQSCFKQTISLCLIERWKRLVCNFFHKNINFLIKAINKLFQFEDHQHIKQLLGLYYCYDDGQLYKSQIQIQKTHLTPININQAILLYQNTSLIVLNSTKNQLLYIGLLSQLLKIIQSFYIRIIQQKYPASLLLISNQEQFQDYIRQKQEWTQLKNILTLAGVQTKLQIKSQTFFQKVVKIILIQLQQKRAGQNLQDKRNKLFLKSIQFGTSLMKYIQEEIQFQIKIKQVIKLLQVISTQSIYRIGKESSFNQADDQLNKNMFLFVLSIANKAFTQSPDLYFIQQFKDSQMKQDLKQIVKQKLLKILGLLLFLPKTPEPIPSITRVTIQLLSNLYNKIFRTKILPTKIFQNQSFVQKLKKYNSKISISQEILIFLYKFPFVFPVDLRMERFREIVRNDRHKFLYQYNHYDDQDDGKLVIRRNYEFIDAFDKLKNSNIKKRFQIVFVNQYGIKQLGIDAGGLTKQFLNRVLKSVLNPIYGMFIQNSQKQLFPHPQKAQLKNCVQVEYYEFIGKLMAKAIYQNITLGPKFSGPFLNAIVGKKNSFDDLRKIDLDLYKSLVYIKDMQEDAKQLELTFMYNDEIRKIPVLLKSNGHKIKVTNQNKKQYINLLANYKVNKLLQYQCRYIKKGFSSIINKEWFSMFNYEQLNYLISGTGVIDIQDMKTFTKLVGYSYQDQTIVNFWSVVKEFSQQEKSKLLMFITSCPRPSYLGFKDLSPQITIVKMMHGDKNTLPISHTCSNILQLPDYEHRQTLKLKLKMSINSNSGFQFG